MDHEEAGRYWNENIDYRVASAVALPFDDASFDSAVGVMSFMDIPEENASKILGGFTGRGCCCTTKARYGHKKMLTCRSRFYTSR